ncbi:hypothetical protein K2173_007884 [Erythroxylum novogranatense]|uniref:Uncharacterized protein n=1 Tax=Erythroxylum novogranatense TaxID=1862640 RepID=A0AAV8T6Q6_9ROSI|nr:hypothetical protein K2173_007884 [Erythroxylum novogranatense]
MPNRLNKDLHRLSDRRSVEILALRSSLRACLLPDLLICSFVYSISLKGFRLSKEDGSSNIIQPRNGVFQVRRRSGKMGLQRQGCVDRWNGDDNLCSCETVDSVWSVKRFNISRVKLQRSNCGIGWRK